ncbi:MAG: hypothetical protein LUQ26_13590, partial [Methylococcaceae bacterium]|nr:hypothetical protein [Methylococcaceae bacterium]
MSDTFSRQVWTPNKIEIHPCPTYRTTGQDSCRRPDRVIVAEQLAHRRSERPAQTRTKPRAIRATAPNQLYSWDITYLPSLIR